MSNPDHEQKLNEAITAEASAYRAHIRALLDNIAVSAGREPAELSSTLQRSIDMFFELRRNSLHEWLAHARAIVVNEQVAVGRLEDLVSELVQLHRSDLEALRGLNSIEAGGPHANKS